MIVLKKAPGRLRMKPPLVFNNATAQHGPIFCKVRATAGSEESHYAYGQISFAPQQTNYLNKKVTL
jgi:hypothetical protein